MCVDQNPLPPPLPQEEPEEQEEPPLEQLEQEEPEELSCVRRVVAEEINRFSPMLWSSVVADRFRTEVIFLSIGAACTLRLRTMP